MSSPYSVPDSSTTKPDARRFDLGRVIAATIFCGLLILNAMVMFVDLPEQLPLKVVGIASRLLTLAFYAMLTFAYLRRTPTERTDRDWRAWLVAFLGTLSPFFIPLVADSGRDGTAPLAVAGLVVSVVGVTAMVWALAGLGTNISIVPQARAVVTDGAYARVRHPLYSAELITTFGLCLTFTGWRPWAVFALLVSFQYLRARREEALLTRELDGYAEYMACTPMLVPRLRRS